MAQLGVGGIDLLPEPGSAAARREEWIRDHPRRYTAQRTLVGIGKVLVPLLLAYLAARFAISLSWPHWRLHLPWPDVGRPWFDWPDLGWPWIGWLLLVAAVFLVLNGACWSGRSGTAVC